MRLGKIKVYKYTQTTSDRSSCSNLNFTTHVPDTVISASGCNIKVKERNYYGKQAYYRYGIWYIQIASKTSKVPEQINLK